MFNILPALFILLLQGPWGPSEAVLIHQLMVQHRVAALNGDQAVCLPHQTHAFGAAPQRRLPCATVETDQEPKTACILPRKVVVCQPAGAYDSVGRLRDGPCR